LRKRHFVLSLFVVAVLFSCSDDDRSLAWESYADLFADPVDYAILHGSEKICAADFDCDGYCDLAVLCFRRYKVFLLNNGDGTFHRGVTIAALAMCGDMGIGDYDGDGYIDLSLAESSADRIRILYNKCTEGSWDTLVVLTGDRPIGICSGDFDDDGDIIWQLPMLEAMMFRC
jgi:hypothetical protein